MSRAGPRRRGGLGRLSTALIAVAVAASLAGCAVPVEAPAPVQPPPSMPIDTAVPEPAPAVAAVPTPPPAAPEPQPLGDQAPSFATDPLRPSVVIDTDDTSVRTDLWVRVRDGFGMPDLQNALVPKWEQWYASRPDYVQRMTERGGRYLFYVVEEIQKRGMPTELALLPFVESAFNPQAMSVARASGMWQFMPATGKDFDLTQNLFRDDRRDVLASTRAALDYLQMLYGQFGDWQLALAAYNWGQGNVQRAVDRNVKADRPATYDALRMPDETRNYVPKLQAIKNIVLRPLDYAITLPQLENHPYFLTVPITNDIDVAVAVQLADVSPEEFQQLNPQLNKPVILAAGTPQVLLPYDNAALFVKNLRAHRAPLATWTAWVAPATLKPGDVAKRVGMSEADLRAVNRIPPRMLVKAGSTLLVPRNAQKADDVPGQVADGAMMMLAPERPAGRRITFKAGRRGDSVTAVAKRYRVSAEQVASWNDVSPQARFRPGQTIVVIKATPAKASGRAGSKSTRSRQAKSKSHTVRAASSAKRSTRSTSKVASSQADSKL